MKKLRLCILSLFLFAVLFSMLQCVENRPSQVYVKDGKEYGVVKGAFRARWWNYYERAQSFAEGEFYNEAVKDLKSALDGRDEDMRMARTYGMHFIDYFPHRELGIVYFKMGLQKEAEKELELSLSMEETGRAKYFLNEVRKAIIEASNTDTTPPSIHLAADSEIEITNEFSLTMEGEVEDDSYARNIEINEEPLFIELSSKKLSFNKNIKLKKGINEIKIKSSDILGKVTEKKVKVFADFEGPALNINNFADGDRVGEKKVVLNGAIADASGIKSLRVNGDELAYNKEKEIEFAFAVDLKEGDNKIVLAATDISGNTTTGEMSLTYVPQLAKRYKYKNRYLTNQNKPIRVALAGSGVTKLDRIILAELTANKPAGAFRINMKDLDETQTVYYDTMYVDGSATGTYKITTVKINDEPLVIIPGRTIYFSQVVSLDEGENSITLDVIDEEGNNLSKKVKVVRKIQKVMENKSRMSLAVLPFEKTGNISTVNQALYDDFITDAFIDQNRFNIVSRGREFEAALNELKLSQTDLVDEKTALKLGRLVAAEGILTGTVNETANSIEIYARFINAETSEVMDSNDVYSQEKTNDQLRFITNGLALKFRNSFPLIGGIVVETAENKIYADFGTIQGIKREMKFIVYRPGKPIIIAGREYPSDPEELGVATVVNVYEDVSLGELHAQFDPKKIKTEDLIITK